MSKPVLKTSKAAVWSLVFGILSITCLWLLGTIPALILGGIALGKTGGENPEYSGRGTAIAGMVTGCLGVVGGLISIGILSAIFVPATVQDRANAATATIEMGQINVALQNYAITEGVYPADLESLLPLYLSDDDVITTRGGSFDDEIPYPYRPDGFHSGDPATSPVLLNPNPSDDAHTVLYADGKVSTTSDPAIIGLFD